MVSALTRSAVSIYLFSCAIKQSKTNYIMDELLDDIIDCWEMLAEKTSIWGEDLSEDLLDLTYLIQVEDLLNRPGKAALGVTQVFDNDLFGIIFDFHLNALNDKNFYSTIIHEMCHCAVFLTTGSLQKDDNGGHGKNWQQFADKWNATGKFNIFSDGDADTLEKLFSE